jgi:signal transduction histidine kinase
VELDTLCLEVLRQARDLRPDVTLGLGHKDQASLAGDRDLLRQLVLNLVDNGLKYTPAGGRVTLSLYRDETQVRLVVEDTGQGIPPDQIPLIFDRFYRGPDSHVRYPAGAGIGLAISRWIARAHSGDIMVESEVGRGSVFTVILPLASASQDGEVARDSTVPPSGLASAGGAEEQ